MGETQAWGRKAAGVEAPWAGTVTLDRLLGQAGSGPAPGDAGGCLAGLVTRRAARRSELRDNLCLWDVATCSELCSDRLRNRRTSPAAALSGHRAAVTWPRRCCLQSGPPVGLPRATHVEGTYKPLVLFLLASFPRTQPSGPLGRALGDQKPPPATPGSGTNSERPLPRLNLQ